MSNLPRVPDDPDQARARQNMCTRKIGFPTQASARLRIKAMTDNGNKAGNRLQVYKCPFCTLYHLGNKQEKRRKHHVRQRPDQSVQPTR